MRQASIDHEHGRKMRELRTMDIICIDITNKCDLRCSNCTRFIGHWTRNREYEMEPEYFRLAVRSLRDFHGVTAVIGGEPTIHSRFDELCVIFKEEQPDIHKRGLWSNTKGRYNEWNTKLDFSTIFGAYNLNDHVSSPIVHTPMLIKYEDLGLTREQHSDYVEKCWVQMTWSATINPKGGFFCEVAGNLSMLYGGPEGKDISDPDWWRKPLTEFEEQKQWACFQCGACIPLKPRRSIDGTEDISPYHLALLQRISSPKIEKGKYEIFDKGIDPTQKRSQTWYWGHE